MNIKLNNMALRILSTMVLVPLMILFYAFGAPIWGLFVAWIIGALAFEWFKLIGNTCPKLWATTMGVGAAGLFLVPGFCHWYGVLFGLPSLIHQKKHKRLAIIAGVYIFIPMAFIFTLKAINPLLLLWLMATAWVTDAFAMFAGKTIGGKKLAPNISPHKTWAGFLGGICGGLMVTLFFTTYLNFPHTAPFYICTVLLSTIGQLGDLFESAFKRKFNTKDSGTLIPGHGGMLDRFDSLLFATPAAMAFYTLGFLSFS